MDINNKIINKKNKKRPKYREKKEHKQIKECKICLEDDNQDNMVSPCLCKGSLKYVHHICLENYHLVTEKYKEKCSICGWYYKFENNYNYDTILNVLTVLYGFYLNNVLCIIISLNSNFFIFICLTSFITFTNLYFYKKKIFMINLFKNINEKMISNCYNFANDYISKHLFISFCMIIFYKLLVNFNLIDFKNDNNFIIIYLLYTVIHFIKLYSRIKNNCSEKKIINKV